MEFLFHFPLFYSIHWFSVYLSHYHILIAIPLLNCEMGNVMPHFLKLLLWVKLCHIPYEFQEQFGNFCKIYSDFKTCKTNRGNSHCRNIISLSLSFFVWCSLFILSSFLEFLVYRSCTHIPRCIIFVADSVCKYCSYDFVISHH